MKTKIKGKLPKEFIEARKKYLEARKKYKPQIEKQIGRASCRERV